MAKRAFSCVVLTLLLFCPWGLKAQEIEKPLINADVVSMIKAGLPESTIVLAIRLAGQRSSTNFDTSPSALIELKSGGATEEVLNAVLNAQSGRAIPPESPVPGLPAKVGVYYQGPSGWIGLSSCLLWPAFGTSLRATAGFWSRDTVMVLPGQQAPLQISEPKPTFCVRGQPETGWRVLRLTKREDRRELRLTTGDIFAAEIRFRPGDIREIGLTSLGREVFTATPSRELEAGEYLLCSEVRAARRVLQCYEFGVTAGKPPQAPDTI